MGAGTPFRERLAAAVAARESSIVLGLDPDPARVWPEAVDAAGPRGEGGPAAWAADLVVAQCSALIAAAGPACVAVKPQAACFERLGSAGWAALERVAAAARAAGLLVLLDAKRGDIGVSAQAYADGLLGPAPGLDADALTVNPYLGEDALEPFVRTQKGIFVLVRTSNPGAADLQDARLDTGEPLWERTARLVDGLDANAVVGATAPEHLERARELMPRATFLLPGVGAQGGRVEDLAPAFAPGPHGGLVTASRSIARAHEAGGGEPAPAARAEAERLREAAWTLRG
ncbi:MAG TPA: orotidine-5'-phosphate decarboxylase [Solirubrobacteraceae bacterium]|nr:orotidine-5'-phosphate decarboxylase [Solirubrobacteraceae bacterium]